MKKSKNTGSTFDSFLKEEGIVVKGKKFDQGKPDPTLISKDALWGIAQAFSYGAKKYGRHNYKQGIEMSRLLAAAMRHISQYNEGEDVDEESGNNHLFHAGAAICMAIYMHYNKPEMDNRYKTIEKGFLRGMEEALANEKK